jgi:hypothetical protein
MPDQIEIYFYGWRKTGGPREKPLWQGRESTNNSTHMKYPSRGSNPQPIGSKVVRGKHIITTPAAPPNIYLIITGFVLLGDYKIPGVFQGINIKIPHRFLQSTAILARTE